MTPEFSQGNTWIIRIRDENLFHDHSSNIYTFTARRVHKLDRAAQVFFHQVKYKKDVNRDSHIASSPIPQISFFEEVRYLILASSQRKLRGYIACLTFDVTVKKKIKKFKFV